MRKKSYEKAEQKKKKRGRKLFLKGKKEYLWKKIRIKTEKKWCNSKNWQYSVPSSSLFPQSLLRKLKSLSDWLQQQAAPKNTEDLEK